MSPGAARSLPICDNPGCEQRFSDLERRTDELERALRSEGGIYDTLKRLEVQLATFTATVTASVRTAAALGSGVGAIVGALFGAAVAIGLALMKNG